MMTEATYFFPVGKIVSCLELGLNACCRAHALPLQAYSMFINYQYYWMTLNDKKKFS
jgi:hypothetical protein